MKFKYSPLARRDVREALAYLDENSASAGERLRTRLVAAVELLARGILDGPEVQLKTGERVRTWIVES